MSRIFTLVILIQFCLNAQSITALLKSVDNNSVLHMSYLQQTFVCKPYGVETIDELIERTDTNSTCKQYLYDFREVNPKERFFAVSSLHVQQQYSVSGIDGRCILHLSSENSYSEALLENGYARVSPMLVFADKLINYRFKQAIKRAKIKKAGIWSDLNIRNCFLLPKKK